MEVHQAGLIDYWTRVEVEKNRNAEFCLKIAKKKLENKSQLFNNQTRRISLKNFTGVFTFWLLVIYFPSFASLARISPQNIIGKIHVRPGVIWPVSNSMVKTGGEPQTSCK
jgi:hypothetical protein